MTMLGSIGACIFILHPRDSGAIFPHCITSRLLFKAAEEHVHLGTVVFSGPLHPHVKVAIRCSASMRSRDSDLPGPEHYQNDEREKKEKGVNKASSSKKAHQLLLQLLQKEEGRVNT